MKTNAQFDGAWRDLMVARRSENIVRIQQAAEQVAYAARMLQLDDGLDEQIKLNPSPVEPEA